MRMRFFFSYLFSNYFIKGLNRQIRLLSASAIIALQELFSRLICVLIVP